MVLHYRGLAHHWTAVYQPLCFWVDREDLYSLALLGLIHAVDTFDPSRGASFSGWAATCIRREILGSDEVTRGLPKGRYSRWRKLEAARERLAGSLGRMPTDDEIAVEVGLTEGQVQETYRAIALFWAVGVDAPDEGEPDAIEQIPAPCPDSTGPAIPEGLAEALACLKPLNQQIVREKARGTPSRVIAQKLGITGKDPINSVDQRYKRALKKMRARLARTGGVE
ncbi:MAG: sigma-70 family RNA polymerase sigma factor [Armatimonadetes bacterium]|nr:sigma-70 family RNA polymerase sigma factor [Armatimonadota bacterium]